MRVGVLHVVQRGPRLRDGADAIIESIVETPDTFPFKTKGVLVGSSNYEKLERNRYELKFENEKIEGILDGGHNMLAIGTHIPVVEHVHGKRPRSRTSARLTLALTW